MILETQEFERRFLLHVLPRGFVRMRYYGILANCQRREKIDRRQLSWGCYLLPELKRVKANTVRKSRNALRRAYAKVTLADIRGWFRHCGYSVPSTLKSKTL